MSNRVEQLEATVSELQSTVDALTEELVETKERLRVAEAELDVEAGEYVAPEPTLPRKEAEPDEIERAVEADAEAVEADKAARTQESDEPDEPGLELSDDIIVA